MALFSYMPTDTASGAVQIYWRTLGESGPWITLLHGFPTSSEDWNKLTSKLARKNRLLLFDFPGFGFSSKPRDYAYSTFDRADLTEALWRHLGVRQTILLAHDMGSTVALELFARQREGKITAKIERAFLLNAGLVSELHRPVLTQKLLLHPATAWAAKLLVRRFLFKKQFAKILRRKLSDSDMNRLWESVWRDNGTRIYDRLINYIPERKKHRARWEPMLSSPVCPVHYVWGLADPVSGSHMLEGIRTLDPSIDAVELADCGHYPQLEQPDLVLKALSARGILIE